MNEEKSALKYFLILWSFKALCTKFDTIDVKNNLMTAAQHIGKVYN